MMPAHRIYVEGFGGSGAIGRKKLPASRNIIIEKDDSAAAQLEATMGPGWVVCCGDFLNYTRDGLEDYLENRDALFYLDPPYVRELRRDPAPLYRCEFTTADHMRLCSSMSDSSVKASIMISGYAGSLYEVLLKGWRREDFTVMTRGGPAVESVWMNFSPPTCFHDTRFMGSNFTDRQRIKRKADRWVRKLMNMPHGERQAILDKIKESGL